jgi:Ca2+-transporting ATPase
MQLAFVLAIRSERQSYFSLGWFTNYRLHGAVLVGAALQIAIVYVPWLRGIFHTTPLRAADLGICLLVATTPFWLVEGEKWLARRRGPHLPS